MKKLYFNSAAFLLAWVLLTPVHALEKENHLFGDIGGFRSDLETEGINLDLYHIFDIYDDFSGALEGETAYFGRQRVGLSFDLEALAGIKNSWIVLSGVDQYGRNINRSKFGIFTNPSSLEGRETTRLANFWFSREHLDGRLSYKIGRVDGVGEFGAQVYGSTFMNDELAYVPNAIFGAGLPFDPAQKWGVVVLLRSQADKYEAGYYAKGGVFDSNQLNAYRDDHNGLNFDWEGPVAFAWEIGYTGRSLPGDKPGFVKLGGHWNSGDFTDLGNPTRTIDDSYLIYLSAGKTVLHLDPTGERHLDASFSWTYAPENRNLYHNEFTAILRAVGPFAERPDDEFGIGFIAAFLSEDFSDTEVANGRAAVNEEYTIELTYKAAVTPWLILQPSLQAVFNPAGNRNRDDVWIAGFRSILTF